MITLQAVQLPKPDSLYKKDMAVAKLILQTFRNADFRPKMKLVFSISYPLYAAHIIFYFLIFFNGFLDVFQAIYFCSVNLNNVP